MADVNVLTEVPDALKRLVRCVMRGFYGHEHRVVADLLMAQPCIKEEDLLDCLQFERKQLRAVINALKLDRFIKTRLRVETDAEGKTTKHNYYFVSYNVFVNVVKYKLDHIRRRIDSEERDMAHRAAFVCSDCKKQFTDFEVGQLMDMSTGRLTCTFCYAEVYDESAAAPGGGEGGSGAGGVGGDARTLMIKFNEQVELIYSLLQEVEKIKLSAEILEPEPQDLKTSRSGAGGSRGPGDGVRWSGDSTRHGGIGYENQITITTGEEETGRGTVPVKEQPIWMSHSTVEGSLSEPSISSASGKSVPSRQSSRVADPSGGGGNGRGGAGAVDDIMRTLLSHEKRPSASQGAHTSGGAAAPGGVGTFNDASDTSDSDDEDGGGIRRGSAPTRRGAVAAPASATLSGGGGGAGVEEMESDGEGEGEEDPRVRLVSVRGVQHPYQDITPDLFALMTPAEKQEYIQQGRDIYQAIYD